MNGNAIHDRGHAEFSDAIVHVVAIVTRGADIAATGPQGQVGTGEVGGTAQQFRQHGTVAV